MPKKVSQLQNLGHNTYMHEQLRTQIVKIIFLNVFNKVFLLIFIFNCVPINEYNCKEPKNYINFFIFFKHTEGT